MPAQPANAEIIDCIVGLSRKLLAEDENITGVLQEVAAAGCALLANCSAASVTLVEDGRPRTVAATDERAVAVDEKQYEADEGPCLTASRTERVVRIDSMCEERRWEAARRAAAGRGFASLLSVPFVLPDARAFGALNLYSEIEAGFSAEDEQVCQEFTTHASAVVANARAYWSAVENARQLTAAMESRATIEQAKGILIAARGCTAEEAFEVLREASRRQNRKLRDVAHDVVEAARGE